MSPYSAYRERLNNSGSTSQDSIINATKRQQMSLMMSSPTLSYVTLNDEEDTRPSIVSDIETFNKRRFLFLPDSEVNVGDYIKHDKKIYLATDKTTDEIYPQLFGELCNSVFKFVKGQTRIIIDTDYRGAPIYETVDDEVEIPCVMTTKIYSALSNSPIPLPSGAMIIKIPYDPEIVVPLNYPYKIKSSQYKVTSVDYDNILDEVGYIEINLMVTQNEVET